MADEQELQAEIERLRAENEKLKSRPERQIRLKVSEKGGVSLYGIRRFPVTFYADEWGTILGQTDEIRKFIREHEGELKRR